MPPPVSTVMLAELLFPPDLAKVTEMSMASPAFLDTELKLELIEEMNLSSWSQLKVGE